MILLCLCIFIGGVGLGVADLKWQFELVLLIEAQIYNN